MTEGDEFRHYFSEDSFLHASNSQFFFFLDYYHTISMLEPFSEKLHSLNSLVP